MKIEVTQADIAAGKRVDPMLCPVARAISRAAGEVYQVHSSAAVRIDDDSWDEHLIDLPNEAEGFVEAFDRGETVQPFSFELELEAVTA